jgi:hypothetical protein
VEILLAFVLLVVLAWFVTGPLRHPAGEEGREDPGEDPQLADLEARKEAKYREIRDAELDHAQGKLSDGDWERQDAELRREAIAILKELDQAGGDSSRR